MMSGASKARVDQEAARREGAASGRDRCPAGYDLVPGTSIHRELQLLVRAGLTPLEALQTATLNPALYFGKTAEWGTVAPALRLKVMELAAK